MGRIITVLLIVSSLLIAGCRNSSNTCKDDATCGVITISGAFALYPLTVRWAEEYKKLHPKVRIDVSAGGAGKGMTDALTGMVDIGLVSRELHSEEVSKGALAIAVAKDAVVPTISGLHPQLKEVLAHGLTKDALEALFVNNNITSWYDVGIKSKLPVHVYTRSDAAGAAESWAAYFGRRQEDLKGVGVFGDPGLAQAVQKDASGIGYNGLLYIYDMHTKRQDYGIFAVPIDLNANGRIDPEENFYTTADVMVDAIARNKYPSPPARDLFFVTKGKPQRALVNDFMAWVLSEGQRYVHEAGYINLPKERIDEELIKLNK